VCNLACFGRESARDGDGRLRPSQWLSYILGGLSSRRGYALLVDVLESLLKFAEVPDAATALFVVRGIRRSRDRT
jgi:hypothetical protein